MAEIKSTLDLVMERTKNMTLSEDEKNEQRADELRKKLNGLIQKYADGFLSIDHFERDLGNLDSGDTDLRDVLTNELLVKIGLEKDNDALFDLLEKCCGAEVNQITRILDDYGHAVETARQNRITAFAKQFQKKHSISGSAVLPDLDADEEWQQELAGIQIQFGGKMNRETEALKKR